MSSHRQVLREAEERSKSQVQFVGKPQITQTNALVQTTQGRGRAPWGGVERPALRLLLKLQIGFCGWPFSLSRNN